MKTKKLLKTLADFLDKEGRKQRKHREELEILLAGLEKKEHTLEAKSRGEKDANKQKRLGKELEIVRAQRAKGKKALKDLEKY